MTTATVRHVPPPLRRLPVPVAQPRPALRVLRDEPDDIPAAQGLLALALPPDHAEEGADTGAVPAANGTTPSPRPTPNGYPAPDPVAVRGPQDLDHHARVASPEESTAPRRSWGQVLPEPRQWVAQFVQAAIEVTTGLRPPSQLLRWTNDEVQAMLTRRGNLAHAAATRGLRPPRSVVRSARVCIPREGVAEASAVVTDGSRVRAVAVRLEGLDGRWRVTALRIG